MDVQNALNAQSVCCHSAQLQAIVPTERSIRNNQMDVQDARRVVNVLHYPVQCCLLNALMET